MKSKPFHLCLAMSLIATWALPAIGQGASGSTAIKLADPHPGFPNQLLPQSVNNRGDIVGHIGDERDGVGFIRTSDGQFQEFVFPGQCEPLHAPGMCTYPQGINDRGQIVGFVFLAAGGQGFLRQKDGTMITLPPSPANTPPDPFAINNRGDIVGSYTDRTTHGFLLREGDFTTIDFPGSTETFCTGINNSGHVTGWYLQSDNTFHGFIWDRGNFVATFQISTSNGPADTFPVAINDAGQVAAVPVLNNGSPVAFVRNPDGTFTTVDLATLLHPIGSVAGVLMGINNHGDLVGWFSASIFDIFGFLIPNGAPTP